jgi:hypothetical protein
MQTQRTVNPRSRPKIVAADVSRLNSLGSNTEVRAGSRRLLLMKRFFGNIPSEVLRAGAKRKPECWRKRLLCCLLLLNFLCAASGLAVDKKIVFIAGAPSHGPGEHEHRAGCLLLKSCLDQVGGITSVVCSNGWPDQPETTFADAATVVVYSDGGSGHPLLQDDRLRTIGNLMKRGVGLVCVHYAVEPTKEKGEAEFLNWLGGCFEVNRSVNPVWKADFAKLAVHPVTRGVIPFEISDEWYFHMRFRAEMEGVTPILTAVPPESTMSRHNGPHEGNPEVREAVKRGELETVAWACQRADGGRGFGFTGAHFHKNWGKDNFRKLVLNAIVWTARMEVPADGVPSHLAPDALTQNLDAKGDGSGRK